MHISANRGRILGAALGKTVAIIPDLIPEFPLLVVEGEASGPTPEFLAFVAQSPVKEAIDHVTDGVEASGSARLGLKFELPLDPANLKAKVAGELALADNQVRWPGVPPMERVNARIGFTERGVAVRDGTLEALGGPAKVNVSSRDGTLRITGAGRAQLAQVKDRYPMPLASRLGGAGDWAIDLTAREGATTWTLTSSLDGVSIDLPEPLGKPAAGARPLTVERRLLAGGKRELVRVGYDNLLRASTTRIPAAKSAEGTLVLVGKAAGGEGLPEQPGLVIRGDLPSVDVDAWLAFARAPAAPGSATAEEDGLDLQSIDLTAGALVVFGRRLDETRLSAQQVKDRWRLRFASQQAEGTASWEPSGEKHANGRLVARLSRLVLAQEREARAASAAAPEPARAPGSANPWPSLDVNVEHFHVRGADVGRMEFVARPEGSEWRVSRFSIVNEGGRIDASGLWSLTGARERTRFDVRIDTQNSAAFLARFDLPDEVKGAPGRLAGSLEWEGTPADFEYAALSGSFSVEVGAGQFTKIDPGMGKLLGVLSLQALPRRITLDFRDVFSEGFAFDTIRGGARITSGVLHTDDLTLSGPAAKVLLTGDVDLEHETQRLIVRVQPALSSTVSAGAGAAAAVLLAANPLVGAAVGAGTLLAQKLMKDPIEQMFSYEYSVRGSWSEPLVERVAARVAPVVGESSSGFPPPPAAASPIQAPSGAPAAGDGPQGTGPGVPRAAEPAAARRSTEASVP
jgi:uncharacterized protein (TIGR02099 family)